MAIPHSLTVTTRRPVRSIEFRVAQAARGLTPLDSRLLLVGTLGPGAEQPPLVASQVFAPIDGDRQFGRSSELALMSRWAFAGGRDYGQSPQVWGIGLPAPEGAAAQHTLTVGGTALRAGNLRIRIAGRTLVAGIARDASPDQIATALHGAIRSRDGELPVATARVGAVVTCTHVTAGVNGNDVRYEVDELPPGVTLELAQVETGAGVVDVTAALDVTLDKSYDIVAIANHALDDVGDLTAHMADAWELTAKRFRHSILAETGTLAAALALSTAANDFRQMVVSAEGFRNTPAELAAYVGAVIAGEDDPARPFNDVELSSLYLPDDADIPQTEEIEAGIAGGLFMLSANANKTRAKVVRAVTSQTSLDDVPFEELLDVTISRSMVYTAEQVDIAQARVTRQAKNHLRSRKRIRSVTLDTLLKVEALEILQNVEEHANELLVETHPSITSRLVTAIPTSVVPPLNQVANTFNLLVE